MLVRRITQFALTLFALVAARAFADGLVFGSTKQQELPVTTATGPAILAPVEFKLSKCVYWYEKDQDGTRIEFNFLFFDKRNPHLEQIRLDTITFKSLPLINGLDTGWGEKIHFWGARSRLTYQGTTLTQFTKTVYPEATYDETLVLEIAPDLTKVSEIRLKIESVLGARKVPYMDVQCVPQPIS